MDAVFQKMYIANYNQNKSYIKHKFTLDKLNLIKYNHIKHY